MSQCINCGNEYAPEVASMLCPTCLARLAKALDEARQSQPNPPPTSAYFKNGKIVVVRTL